MKKYFLHFGIVLLTFALGVGVATFLNLDHFYPPLSDNAIKNDSVEIKHTEDNQEITFKNGPIIDIVWNGRSELPPSVNIYEASDGAIIRSSTSKLKTEKSADRMFQQELKNATKIIDLSPYLDNWNRKTGEKAIVESKGKVCIIELYKVSENNLENFYLTIIETPSLQHARDFEKFEEQGKSFARSMIVNGLNR
jgi:hypothetical protein